VPRPRFSVGHDTRDQAFLFRFGGIEDTTFEQYFERNRGADQVCECRHLAYANP